MAQQKQFASYHSGALFLSGRVAESRCLARFGMLLSFSAFLGILSMELNGQKQTSAPRKQGAAQAYSVVDLGTLGGPNTFGQAINNHGQVVGQSTNATGNHLAFLWADGKMHSLGTLSGWPNSVAVGINDSGQIVGYAKNAGMVAYERGLLWQKGKMTEIGTLPGDPYSSANAINRNGLIAGNSYRMVDASATDPLGIRTTPFLFEKGKRTSLSGLPPHSLATGINTAGDVLGEFENGGGHAFLYQKGKIIDLGTLGGKQSNGSQVDDQGRVVGTAGTTNTGRLDFLYSHAFLWSNHRMIDMGTLGGDSSGATGINSWGEIVGNSKVKPGDHKTEHAFLYANGKMIDLNTRIPRGTNWVLTSANAINNAGQILCSGLQGEQIHTFLLTPK